METEVISVRVKRGTLAQLKAAGIKPKEAMEDIAWKANAKKWFSEMEELLKDSKPSKAGWSVKFLRADRHAH
jgi:hypothetical protein